MTEIEDWTDDPATDLPRQAVQPYNPARLREYVRLVSAASSFVLLSVVVLAGLFTDAADRPAYPALLTGVTTLATSVIAFYFATEQQLARR